VRLFSISLSAGFQRKKVRARSNTRFRDFDNDDHPFRQWWNEYGQYMMSGGGRKESIWAARGWIAREQLMCGKKVTGDSMHEQKEEEINMTEETNVQVETQNLPLTDAQKVAIMTLQRKLFAVTAQHTDLTQKLQAALTKIAADNQIDVKSFMLNDDLDLVPIQVQTPTA
jgi:hypothetical protein